MTPPAHGLTGSLVCISLPAPDPDTGPWRHGALAVPTPSNRESTDAPAASLERETPSTRSHLAACISPMTAHSPAVRTRCGEPRRPLQSPPVPAPNGPAASQDRPGAVRGDLGRVRARPG